VACILLGPFFGLGCADPTVAYHRQFEYLRRIGDEALAEDRLEDARTSMLEASKLAGISAATDLEFIDTLTKLTRACRELGLRGEALAHANRASRALARYRLEQGGASSGVYRVGAAYLLERGRLEIALGDFVAAEAALTDFVRIRGDGGGDERESTEAEALLGELRLARGLDQEARANFRTSLEQARGLGERDQALFGFALLRVAEAKLARKRAASAAALTAEARPEGVAVSAVRPGLLLMLGRIAASGNNKERAVARLEEGLELLASGDPVFQKEIAAPARAVALAAQLFDPATQADALASAALRALDVAEGGSPLRRMQAGRSALAAGRVLFDAGSWGAGVQIMIDGRNAIANSVGDRPHDALVEADFEIATAFAQRNRLAEASRRCDGLVELSSRLSDRARALQPQRLLRCGRIAARASDTARAREAFGRALMIVDEDAGAPGVRIELLLRLAALAHQENRDAEEEKLFDRALAFVLPGVYDHLEKLLIAAYAPYGTTQPSSAAARLAHAAARTPGYSVEAPQLQALAKKLSEQPLPGSL
jgi:tetratricopeptide (TPR) repeat protein